MRHLQRYCSAGRRLSLAALIASAMVAGALSDVASASLTPQLFWSDQATMTIASANLDGTGVNTNFITGQNFPVAIALDGQHIYWTNAGAQAIGRANIDGSSPNGGFITGVTDGTNGVTVDAGHVYWANEFNRVIGRANLDGTGVDQSFIPVTVSRPLSVTVDASHIYWTNFDTNAIGRANLDGTGVDQSFITGAQAPFGLAVDGAHIYWANEAGDTIGRANLDGSNVDENFISAVHPSALAVGAGHIYWTNPAAQTIGRANIDGSSADQSFITTSASGIAVLTVPDAPGGVTASAGDAQATVSFTQPPANGSPITSYTVTASPGGQTASGSASPITVSGLTNGTAYTFTVTATNGVGTGAASSASNSVTPVRPPILVTTTSDSGPGSLRQAIADANARPGGTIDFHIPESDPGFNGHWFTIVPLTSLPNLVANGTTIDGGTQTAFTGDTNPAGPEILLDGRSVVSDSPDTPGGLWITSSSTTVEGLTVSGFVGEEIVISGGNGDTLSGDYVGTDPTGTSAILPPPDSRAFEDDGIWVVDGATNTVIGGTTAGARNVISGNDGAGILASSPDVGIAIEGNYIGTDASGDAALGNAGAGIAMGPEGNWANEPGPSNVTVGGTAPGAGNLISGNGGANDAAGIGLGGVSGVIAIQGNLIGTDAGGGHAIPNENGVVFYGDVGTALIGGNVISGNTQIGVDIQGSSTANTVSGNLIGTDEAGTAGVPNGGDGVLFEQGASGNAVTANTIAFNGGTGVTVLDGTHDKISRNSIYANGGLGIDLGGDGVTANDPGDSDAGPNALQNFPVLTSAANPSGHVTITGTISTANPHAVVIELYAAGGDASGYGEGAVFLGTATPTTGGTFSVTLPAVAPGTLISATATDAAGDTSEFAHDIPVTGLGPANTAVPTVTGAATGGQALTGNRGTWTGTAPITYTYEWDRCDAAGANCTAIGSGGTSINYTVHAADVGSTLELRVTATNASGHASISSLPTAVVAPGPAPANTAAPTVSGTAALGQILSGTHGTWSNTPTSYTYQWNDCDAGGSACSAVPSGGSGLTYTVRAGDAGHTLELVVGATNAYGITWASSAPTAVVAPGPAPSNTAVPTITGTAAIGQVLAGSRGTWTGAPTSYHYQWERCDSGGANCAAISTAGAGINYTVHDGDTGFTLELQVTATNATGSTPAMSAHTAVVPAVAPANTSAPTVTGSVTVGQSETGNRGAWSGSPPITYTYQWLRCDSTGSNCIPIASGAHGLNYLPQAADIGHTLELQVTAANTAGPTVATSAPTAVIHS